MLIYVISFIIYRSHEVINNQFPHSWPFIDTMLIYVDNLIK